MHKHATSYIEQILEAMSHKTAACTATHLPSLKPSKFDEQDMWEKSGQTHKWHSIGPLHRDEQGVGQPAKTYLQQLCTDMRCNLEDLLGSDGW